jgi:hypothetical protein
MALIPFPLPYKTLSVTSEFPDPAAAAAPPCLRLIVELENGYVLTIPINGRDRAIWLIDELVSNTAALWPCARLSAGNGRRSMVAAAPGAPATAGAIDPSDSRRL